MPRSSPWPYFFSGLPPASCARQACRLLSSARHVGGPSLGTPPTGHPLRKAHPSPPTLHSRHTAGRWRLAPAVRVAATATTATAMWRPYPPPPSPGDRPGRRYKLPGAADTTTTTLRLALGDITTAPTDAVVNAANEHMLGGRGVDGAIHAAAGPALLAACRALPLISPDVRVRTGDAVLLPGGTGQLRAAYVIGAVGPIYADDAGSAPLLASAVRRSLRLAAAEPSIRSVAFPALSCGVYGYPPRSAARVNMRVLAEEAAEGGCLAGGELDEVWYYLFSPALYDTWAAAATKAFGEGTPV